MEQLKVLNESPNQTSQLQFFYQSVQKPHSSQEEDLKPEWRFFINVPKQYLEVVVFSLSQRPRLSGK